MDTTPSNPVLILAIVCHSIAFAAFVRAAIQNKHVAALMLGSAWFIMLLERVLDLAWPLLLFGLSRHDMDTAFGAASSFPLIAGTLAILWGREPYQIHVAAVGLVLFGMEFYHPVSALGLHGNIAYISETIFGSLSVVAVGVVGFVELGILYPSKKWPKIAMTIASLFWIGGIIPYHFCESESVKNLAGVVRPIAALVMALMLAEVIKTLPPTMWVIRFGFRKFTEHYGLVARPSATA